MAIENYKSTNGQNENNKFSIRYQKALPKYREVTYHDWEGLGFIVSISNVQLREKLGDHATKCLLTGHTWHPNDLIYFGPQPISRGRRLKSGPMVLVFHGPTWSCGLAGSERSWRLAFLKLCPTVLIPM